MAEYEEPYSSEEFVELLKAVEEGNFVLDAKPVVVRRLEKTFVAVGDEGKGKVLHAISRLSAEEKNVEVLLELMENILELVEKFAVQHSDLDGHRDTENDAIYRDLLSYLMSSCGYNFRAAHLLELTDGSMPTSFAALAALLRGPFGHPPISLLMTDDIAFYTASVMRTGCAIRVLRDFTTCDAYFSSGDSRDYQSIDIVKLNSEFAHSVSEVSRCLLQYPILDLITVHLEEWFQLLKTSRKGSMRGLAAMCGGPALTPPQPPPLRLLQDTFTDALTSTLSMISNLLTYTTEFSSRLRKYIANQTILIQNLVLPYALFLCDALETPQPPTDEAAGYLKSCVRQLLYIIKVLSFVTFRVKVFRAWFRTNNFTKRLLCSEVLMASNLKIEIVALLARLNINIDVADDTHHHSDEVITQFHHVWRGMTQPQQTRLSCILSSPVEVMYPVNKFCKSYKELRYMWAGKVPLGAPQDEEEEEEEDSEDSSGFKFKFDFQPGSAETVTPFRATRGRAAGGIRRRLGRGRGRGVTCARSKPYQTWRHRQRQRELLAKRYASLQYGKKPKQVEKEDPESDNEIEMVEMKTETTEEVREKLQEAAKVTAPPPKVPSWMKEAGVEVGGKVETPVTIFKPTRLAPLKHLEGVTMNALFGGAKKCEELQEDVPTTHETRIIWQPETQLAEADDHKHSEAADIPSSFLCAFTHQMLINPVLSPYGDVFERGPILKWLKDSTTCPVTDKPLSVEDLVYDHSLKSDIEKYRVKNSIEATF